MKDILTESEAKERWCPLYRGMVEAESAKEQTVTGFNSIVPGETKVDMRVGKCVASECMAWRLAHKPSNSGEETGYCGAFGLPRFT